ncbi:MAG: CAP domain-containing protein [Acidobacteria bacterium]|nr:CAP domain-containing protein [Acidobacteriota bacterium]
MNCRSTRLWIVALLLGACVLSGGLPGRAPECRAAEGLPDYPVNPYATITWEQELLEITNRQRMEQGLAPLVMDAQLMAVARSHSMGMARQGFISHDLPSGSLQSRLVRAGYYSEVARENVASARTVHRAHRALLESPPHKSNILATDVTRIGIGVVRHPSLCDKYLYVTEVFARPLEVGTGSAAVPDSPDAMVRSLLAERVHDLRKEGGGPMDSDPLLHEIAAKSVDSLSLPCDRTQIRSLLAASAGRLQEKGKSDLSRLEAVVQLVRNPGNLRLPARNPEGRAKSYGSAVRRVTDDQNQPAFLVLTLIGIGR